jgi:hypothetical protein
LRHLHGTPPATIVRSYLGPPSQSKLHVGREHTQFTAYAVYSDGSVATLRDAQGNAVTAWTSASAQVGSITSGGTFTAVGPGSTNIVAKIGSITASPWGITVTAPPVTKTPPATLVRAYLGASGNENVLTVGGMLPFTAYGVYSDGSVATLPDAQGNTVTAWTSSAPQVASIGSEGVVMLF